MDAKALMAPMAMMVIHTSGVDLNTDENKQIVRMAFGSSIAVVFALVFHLFYHIYSRNDPRKVTVEEKDAWNPDTKTNMSKKEYTYSEYDQKELQKIIQQTLMSVLITGGIHYKWGTAQPLVFQALSLPFGVLQHNLFKIHVLGADDELENLQRPWKEVKPKFLETLQGMAEPDKDAEEEEPEKEAVKAVKDVKKKEKKQVKEASDSDADDGDVLLDKEEKKEKKKSNRTRRDN